MTRPLITTDPYRILVTGSRRLSLAQRRIVDTELFAAVNLDGTVIVHGDCPTGVDAYAAQWAFVRGYTVERHPAKDFGRWPGSGPQRNSHMVSLGADLCLGFPGPGSKGTWDCLRKAVDAGIPTRAYSLDAIPDPPTKEAK